MILKRYLTPFPTQAVPKQNNSHPEEDLSPPTELSCTSSTGGLGEVLGEGFLVGCGGRW
jgi:hypothetical protein